MLESERERQMTTFLRIISTAIMAGAMMTGTVLAQDDDHTTTCRTLLQTNGIGTLAKDILFIQNEWEKGLSKPLAPFKWSEPALSQMLVAACQQDPNATDQDLRIAAVLLVGVKDGLVKP